MRATRVIAWAGAALLLCGACGKSKDGPSATATSGAGLHGGGAVPTGKLPAQQVVDFVYVQRDPGGGGPAILTGGMSKATISMEANPAREVDVTISEECPGCAGSAWSSSIWMGAFLSSTLHGDYLADHKFSVRARGFIDGPSAGALLSATMLSMLTGHKVRPKVAMTGALNPDGSVGPVGGIPQKLIAAVKAGMETFCYPAAQSLVWDANFRTGVEVQQLAQRHGIAARPVKDLREAYACLTGVELPRDERVVEADAMKDSFGQMRTITEGWLGRSRSAFEQLKTTPGRERFTPWVVKVRAAHDTAEADLKIGRVPVAYHKAMQAAAGFEVLLLAARAQEAKKGGDVAKLITSMEPLTQVEGELKALQQQMGAAKLTSVGTVLNLLWAQGSAAQAYGFLDAARAAEQPERKVQLLFGAKMALEHAKDVWSAWKDEKVQTELRLNAKEVGVLAHSYLSAATASFQYYRALSSETRGLAGEPLVVLRQLSYASEHLQQEGLPGALAALGASLQSYVDASYLMANGYLRQFYEKNAQLKERTVRRGGDSSDDAPWATYMDLLEYADRRARESATQAQRVLGAIPSSARFHYLAGRDELIHGDESEKQQAIYEFWFSSALSDLAALLAAGPAALRAGGR